MGFEPVHLALGQFEHQFVVHLHDHLDLRLVGIQFLLHSHHGQLDEVGRRALHGGVDGGAFSPGAAGAVGGVDLGQVQAAAKHGFDIAHGFGGGLGVVHVLLYAGVALEVFVDVCGGCFGLYP